MAKPWTWAKRTMRLMRSGAYLGMSVEKAKYRGKRQLVYSAMIFGTTLLTFGGQVVSSVGRGVTRGSKKLFKGKQGSGSTKARGKTYREAPMRDLGRDGEVEVEEYPNSSKRDERAYKGGKNVGDVQIPTRSLEDWKREKQEAAEKMASYGEDLDRETYNKGINEKPEGVWVSNIWDKIKELDQDSVWVATDQELRLKLGKDVVKVTALGEMCMFGEVIYLVGGGIKDKEAAMLDYIMYRGKDDLSHFLYLMKLLDFANQKKVA